MSFFAMLLLAFALAADSFVAATTQALGTTAFERRRWKWGTCALFASIQAVLFYLGGWVGSASLVWIRGIDHWVASLLVMGLGFRILWGMRAGVEYDVDCVDYRIAPPKKRNLVLLAVATSLDALGAGAGLALSVPPNGFQVALIATVTFALVALALTWGPRVSSRYGRSFQFFGAVILISMGFKILYEHRSHLFGF